MNTLLRNEPKLIGLLQPVSDAGTLHDLKKALSESRLNLTNHLYEANNHPDQYLKGAADIQNQTLQ